MGLADPDQGGAERRTAPRMRVLKRAKVIFNNGFSTLDCVVRNVSATGALLTLAESAHMPKEFQLTIGDEPPRPARLVYRRTMFAGVRFSDVADEDEPAARTGPQPSLANVQGPAFPPETGAATPQPEPFGVRRIAGERFPQAIVGRLPWSR